MHLNAIQGKESIIIKAAFEASYLVLASLGVFLASKAAFVSNQWDQFEIEGIIILWLTLFLFGISRGRRTGGSSEKEVKGSNEEGELCDRDDFLSEKKWRPTFWFLVGFVFSLSFLGRLFILAGIPGFFLKAFGVEVGVALSMKIIVYATVLNLTWVVLGGVRKKRAM